MAHRSARRSLERVRSSLAIAFIALFAACDGSSGAAAGESCFRTAQCEDGLACVAGRCSTDVTGLGGGMVPSLDAGQVIVPGDAGPRPDGGPLPDAGPTPDTGTPPADSGPPPPVDSGPPPPVDSGPPPPVDSGPPPPMDAGTMGDAG